MALSDPILTVDCDDCGDAEELRLTCTARGWDDRDVPSQLKRLGWTEGDDGNTHYCKDCSERRAKEGK